MTEGLWGGLAWGCGAGWGGVWEREEPCHTAVCCVQANTRGMAGLACWCTL